MADKTYDAVIVGGDAAARPEALRRAAAVGLPIIPVMLEAALFQTRIISTGIARHIEPAALPNFLGQDDRIMPVPRTVGDQLSLLITPELWIGMLIGAAFLYAAARIRGISNEL